MGGCSTFIKGNRQCATSRIGGELVEDRYEFESADYRSAALELKAIAYDVIAKISKKKVELLQQYPNKTEIESILTELNNRNDNLLVLTSKLEEELEALDKIEKEVKGKSSNQKIPVQVKQSAPVIPQPEQVKIEPKPQIVIKPKEEQQKEITIPEEEPVEEYDTEIEEKEQETPPIELPKEQPEKKITKEIAAEQTPIAKQPVTSSIKKKFQKTTKNISKAIMVRPNQLDNLRASRPRQEQTLIDKGIFSPSTETSQELNTVPKKSSKPVLPDDVERKIEDLTVKANIYYNEGEVDKAQELYDQIKKLMNQN